MEVQLLDQNLFDQFRAELERRMKEKITDLEKKYEAKIRVKDEEIERLKSKEETYKRMLEEFKDGMTKNLARMETLLKDTKEETKDSHELVDKGFNYPQNTEGLSPNTSREDENGNTSLMRVYDPRNPSFLNSNSLIQLTNIKLDFRSGNVDHIRQNVMRFMEAASPETMEIFGIPFHISFVSYFVKEWIYGNKRFEEIRFHLNDDSENEFSPEIFTMFNTKRLGFSLDRMRYSSLMQYTDGPVPMILVENGSNIVAVNGKYEILAVYTYDVFEDDSDVCNRCVAMELIKE